MKSAYNSTHTVIPYGEFTDLHYLRWEGETAREGPGYWPPLAEAKKMKSLTVHTHEQEGEQSLVIG